MGKNRFSYNAEEDNSHIELSAAISPSPEPHTHEILLDGKVLQITLDQETIEILTNDRTLTGG
jgi:hypothetical protein